MFSVHITEVFISFRHYCRVEVMVCLFVCKMLCKLCKNFCEILGWVGLGRKTIS